jgi:hypothetical protein
MKEIFKKKKYNKLDIAQHFNFQQKHLFSAIVHISGR